MLPGKQPITPSLSEIDANPRARSAKLRLGVRTSAPARRAIEESLLALTRLPQRNPKGR
jgi:16S rRNA (cytosine1402-N4)-methyltransferase